MRLTLPHLSLKGAGRVYGYILNSAAGGRIQEIEFSQCSQPGCTAAAVDDAQPWVMRFDDDKLPAGDYELMVLADGAPVRVALTLDTLSEVNDNPLDVQPLTAEVLSPTPIVNESERRVYVAGAFSKFETPSFAVLGMWATSNPHVVTAFGNCTQYARTFEAQSDVALSPACPGGAKGVGDNRMVEFAENGVMWTMANEAGAMGMSGWFSLAVPPNRLGIHVLFVK